MNRNVVLVWDVFGKIVDAAINAPGTFHDSRSAWWCKIFDHCRDLPDGYKCCCDDAFYTQGDLMNKLVKTKEEFREGMIRSNYDQQLTHLRQCSEWGNNVLTGTFRILKGRLHVYLLITSCEQKLCGHVFTYITGELRLQEIK